MLKSTLAAMAAVFAISAFSPAMAAKGDPHVLLTTSAGNIELELNSQKAPISVDNFLKYVNCGFYNNTTFHRVIPGFMVQGGGFTPDLKQKRATHPAIVNEARGGLPNLRGTIAMARTNEPHSATCQWFVNTVDNDFLDAKNARDGWGYTVFGRVIRGMDVVDKISSAKTGTRMGMRDVPMQTVKILSVKIKR